MINCFSYSAREPVYQRLASEENTYSVHTMASQCLIQFTVCQRRKDHCHRKEFGKLEYFDVPTSAELSVQTRREIPS